MNTITKTSLRTLLAASALVAVALSQAAPASAKGWYNALTQNALTQNALTQNAFNGNGAQAGGAAFDFDAVTVEAVELPAGTVLAVVPDAPE